MDKQHRETQSSCHRRTIHLALLRLGERHPELGSLIRLVPSHQRVTREFVDAYRRSRVPSARRSLVLRLLLGEAVAGHPMPSPVINRDLLKRLVDWLSYNNALTGQHAHREVVPKSVFTMLGCARSSIAAFISHIAIAPLHRLDTTGDAAWQPYEGLSACDLAPLRRLVESRRLTRVAADQLTGAPGRLPHEGTWWFTTGDATLDLRNALVYCASLLARDRDGGRAQNMIPKSLSDRWSLKRLSIPHLLGFCDVAALAIEGLIDVATVDTDICRLREAMPALRRAATSGKDRDLTEAWLQHRARWRVTADIVEQRQALQSRGERGGQFDSGLLYNINRLLAPGNVLSTLAPYYATLDATRVLTSHADTWNRADPSIVDDLSTWLATKGRGDQSGNAGVRVRDLGNILATLAHLGIEDSATAWAALPTVARWSLGAPPPSATGTGRRTKTRSVSVATPPRIAPLPVLEELWAIRPTAWILSPAADVLSSSMAGPVFVHAAHAAGWSIPSHATVVGQTPLPWGYDPIRAAYNELVRLGYRPRLARAIAEIQSEQRVA